MENETPNRLEPFQEDFGLMIEAGFVAVKQLDEKSARYLFNAASVLRPESVVPKIGLGFIALNKLELKESDRIFQEVVQQEPENYLALCFLGMSYMLQKSKRAQGEELVVRALENTQDASVVHLAKTSLEWSEKDLKKRDTKAPFFKEV